MNASQRRVSRRQVSSILPTLGFHPGAIVSRQTAKGTTQASVIGAAENGTKAVRVKRRDNRTVVWPLSAIAPHVAF